VFLVGLLNLLLNKMALIISLLISQFLTLHLTLTLSAPHHPPHPPPPPTHPSPPPAWPSPNPTHFCRADIATLPPRAAEELQRKHGVRLSNPGVLGFGFQPPIHAIPVNLTVASLLLDKGNLMNDIQQCMVPDEMHVFRGVWDFILKVSDTDCEWLVVSYYYGIVHNLTRVLQVRLRN
jgi:hypothetical protein